MRFSHAMLMVCLLFTGCTSVTSTVPLGDPVTAADAKKLEGVWLNSDDEPMWVKHVKDNELRVASIGWDESKFGLNEFTVFVTEDEGRQFINLANPEKQDPKTGYCFLRIAWQNDEYLLLALPNAELFEKAVKEGKLPGKVTKKDNDTTISIDSAEKLRKFVTPAKAAEQFEFEGSQVLRRVKRFSEDSH